MFGFAERTLKSSARVISLGELETWRAPDRALRARAAYASGDEKLYNALKTNMGPTYDKMVGWGMCPAILAHCAIEGNVKNTQNCLQHANGLLVFDYDDLKHTAGAYDDKHEKAIALLDKLLADGAYCGGLSLSGVGLWIAYKYPEGVAFSDTRVFKRYYLAMADKIAARYDLKLDLSCSNINRWRFLGVEPVRRGTGSFVLPEPVIQEPKPSAAQLNCADYKHRTSLLAWLQSTGQIIGDVKADGSYNLVCPWESEHSSKTGTSDCGWHPEKGFHCFHGSCALRTFKDFIQYQIQRGFADGDHADQLALRLVATGLDDHGVADLVRAQFPLSQGEAEALAKWARSANNSLDSVAAGDGKNPAQLACEYFRGWTYDTSSERLYRPGTKPIAGQRADAVGYTEDEAIAMCYDSLPRGLITRTAITDEVATLKQRHKFDGVLERCKQLASEWDGHDYLAEFAERHFGLDAYVAKRWRKWLVGGAALWLRPGTKQDTIFVLTGRGATQKTLFAERIAMLTSGLPPCDMDITEHNDKDSDIHRSHATVGIYDEVFGGTMTRREGENAKRQATRRQSTVRAAYARGSSTVYFRALQIASSNHPDALPSTDAEKRRYYVARVIVPLQESSEFLRQMLGQAITIAQEWLASDAGKEYALTDYSRERPPWMETDEELRDTIRRNSGFESTDNVNLAILTTLDRLEGLGVRGAPHAWAHYIVTGDPSGLYIAETGAELTFGAQVCKSPGVSEEAVLRRIKERVDCRKHLANLTGKRVWVVNQDQLADAFTIV